MLDIIPAKLDLLGLAEIQHVLDNRNQRVYWWREWEICLSRNPDGLNYHQIQMHGENCKRLRTFKKSLLLALICLSLIIFKIVLVILTFSTMLTLKIFQHVGISAVCFNPSKSVYERSFYWLFCTLVALRKTS